MQKLLWVVLIAALGYGGFRVVSNRGSGDAGAVWEPYTVELGRLKDSIPCDGTLEPTTKTEIKSRVAGEIVQLLVEPGERVAAGQVLAQLDTEELVQEAREAAANLTAARAQYRLAQRGYSPTEAINRESQVAEAQIALDQAEAEYRRVSELHGRGFASDRELEQAKTSRDLARQSYDTALNLQAEVESGGVPEDREVARAAVIRSEATLATAQERLANATIRAPVAGTILTVPVEVGTTVSSGVSANTGGTVIATIGDMGTMVLEGTVDESDIGRVQPGMPCEITTDAYPNLMFKGTVDQIAPQATLEQNVSTFQVDIAVDTANPQPTSGGGRMDFRGTFAGMKGGGGGGRGGPMGAGGMRRAMGAGGARPGGGRSGGGTPSGPRPDAPAPEAPAVAPTLRAGMTATAEIIVSSYEEAPVIPLRYLQYDDEGKPFVWLWPAGTPPPEPPTEEEDEQADAPKPGEGPQPTKAYVEIGYTDGVSYAIKSGIKPGDILVVEQEVEMEATFGAFGIRQQKKSSR